MKRFWVPRSSGTRTVRIYLAFLAILALFGVTLIPGLAMSSPQPQIWNGVTIKASGPRPKVVCLHRETTFRYRVITRGATPPPSTQPPTIQASKGTISNHKYLPAQGTGSFTYQATQQGVEVIFLTMKWKNAYSTDEVRFEIKSCEYSINIHAVSWDKNDLAKMYTSLSGSGRFVVDANNHVNGDGNLDLYLNIWGGAPVIQCKLNPVVKNSGAFKVKNSDLALLIPGYDYVILDLDFDKIPISDISIECLAADDNIKIAPIKLGGGTFEPNELGLIGLSFPSMGGEQTFQFGKTTGTVSVRPRVTE
jgi:hypothetical protein